MAKQSTIQDVNALDQVLREMAHLELKIAEAATAKREEVLVAEGKYTARTQTLFARKTILAEDIELFYRSHRKEFEKGGKKSVELSYGRIGIRATGKAIGKLKGWTWDRVMEAMADSHILDAFLRPKISIDKTGMKKAEIAPEVLTAAGLKISTSERFFIETYPAKEVA